MHFYWMVSYLYVSFRLPLMSLPRQWSCTVPSQPVYRPSLCSSPRRWEIWWRIMNESSKSSKATSSLTREQVGFRFLNAGNIYLWQNNVFLLDMLGWTYRRCCLWNTLRRGSIFCILRLVIFHEFVRWGDMLMLCFLCGVMAKYYTIWLCF